MNIIQETNPGGNIGSQFGTGISAGLQTLLGNKLGQIQQQQQTAKAAQFWSGLGLDPKMAYQFASAPESIQKSLLDRLEGVNIGGQQQGQNQPHQPQMLDQLLGRQEGFAPAEFEQALQNYQEPQAQTTQQGGIKIGANPVERRANAALEQADRLAKEKAAATLKAAEENKKFELQKLGLKRNQAIEASNRPIIKGITEDFSNYKKIYSKAKEMLNIIEKNKDKWPEWSGYAPEKLHRNPEVRRYLKYKNQLTSLLAGARKGQPTNFKVKLEQQSGPELTQPVETQVAVLKDFLDDAQEVFNTQKDMSEILKANPHSEDLLIDLSNKGIERMEKNKAPEEETFSELPDASKFPGKMATNPATGKKMVSVNGKWKAVA